MSSFSRPSEVMSIISLVIYIPCQSNVKLGLELYWVINTWEAAIPEALFTIDGYFTQSNFRSLLPKYHHHISCPTWGVNILDHYYTTILALISTSLIIWLCWNSLIKNYTAVVRGGRQSTSGLPWIGGTASCTRPLHPAWTNIPQSPPVLSQNDLSDCIPKKGNEPGNLDEQGDLFCDEVQIQHFQGWSCIAQKSRMITARLSGMPRETSKQTGGSVQSNGCQVTMAGPEYHHGL